MANQNMVAKTKKIISVILNVLTYIFFAICLVTLLLSVTAKRDIDGAITIGGMQMRIVVSDSMAKCDETYDDIKGYDIKDIPIKSMLFIELVPEEKEQANEWYSKLQTGDVLTFRYVYVQQETITHRIVDIYANKNGGYTIELEGDNKSSDADTLTQTIDTSKEDSPNYVLGKVTGQNYALGVIVSALKSPLGIVCIIIIPCSIIAIFEIVRLVNTLTASKKKKAHEEQLKRDEEFEEMKRQLELLKKQQSQANDGEGQSDTPIDSD